MPTMADISWGRRPPGRGGVVDEIWCRNPAGGTLTLEVRADGSWLWVQDEEGECRVLQFPETDIDSVLEKMSGIDDLPTTSNYLLYMSRLGLTLIAHEQFRKMFVNELHDPGDGGYFYFRDVLGEVEAGSDRPEFSANLGDPIPPSAKAALRRALEEHAARTGRAMPVVRWDVDSRQVPSPDTPRAKLDFCIFELEGGWPKPCGPKPADDVVTAISEVADTGYSVLEWGARAAEIAPRFASRWGEVLGVMAYGAPAPPGRDPFSWWIRVQTAAALVLANLDSGWQGSARRRALIHLALQPVDWVVQAALCALYYVATTTPEARDEVEDLFAFLKTNAASTGYTTYAPALSFLWLWLGPRKIEEFALRQWGGEAWQGGPQYVKIIRGLDLAAYAEQLFMGGPRVAEWDAQLESSTTTRDAFDRESKRAELRARLQTLDPASDAGMELIRAFA